MNSNKGHAKIVLNAACRNFPDSGFIIIKIDDDPTRKDGSDIDFSSNLKNKEDMKYVLEQLTIYSTHFTPN
jgi:hypothetical protein